MRGLDRFDPGAALFPDEADGITTPLKKILKELLATPGKGLRGELLMLCAGVQPPATGSPTLNALVLGVEVLHLATLVHDDLLDRGEQRRGRPAVWKKWGVKTAVLVGDYLFAAAYRLLYSACGKEGMERVNFLLREMVAGELAEEVDKFCIIPVDRYLERIERKTARFFQIACELGAEYAASPRGGRVELGAFGRELGMAYQLLDDWQDLNGGAKRDGKPVFQDLKNGVLTLPLLLISGQPGFAELLAEVQTEGKVLPKHRRLIRKWLATARVEAEVGQWIAGYRRRAEERLADLDLPQSDLLRDYAARFFEEKGKQKRLSTVQ